jgi:hypothetical protein
MPSNSVSSSNSTISVTEIADDDRQLMMSFELPPANDEPSDDRFAICRWEDEGGAVGKVEDHGE